jgi:hypothetical protein
MPAGRLAVPIQLPGKRPVAAVRPGISSHHSASMRQRRRPGGQWRQWPLWLQISTAADSSPMLSASPSTWPPKEWPITARAAPGARRTRCSIIEA